MIRQPAVSGRFYPDDPEALTAILDDFIDTSQPHRQAIGLVVPHAGYIYSGRTAGAVFSRIQVPARTIILCPNHTGLGPPLSIMTYGSWRTPLGDIEIDAELAEALERENPELQPDTMAHEYEHAVEVELPFLQHSNNTRHRFVPIVVGTGKWDRLERLGKAVGAVVDRMDPTTLIIASSDMNHYESDEATRIKDRKAINKVLELDAAGLYETVHREKISMCGFGPAVAMLLAARLRGAARAELVDYATSADASGDFDRVVGYAGIIVS